MMITASNRATENGTTILVLFSFYLIGV